MKSTKNLKCLFAIIILFMLAACGKKNNRVVINNGNNNLTPEFSFGNKGKLILSHPLYIALDEAGSVFISDMGAPAVYQVDNKGKYLRSFGRKGRGPGEYEYPQLIEADDKWVYVSDGFRLVTFDRTKDSSSTVMFKRILGNFDVSNGYIYTYVPGSAGSIEISSNEDLINVYRKTGDLQNTFGDYLESSENEPLPAGISWPLIRIENNKVHVVFKYLPVYRSYTTNGELLIEQDLSVLLPDSSKLIQEYINPISSFTRNQFKPSNTGTVDIHFVNRAFDMYKNRVFVARQGHKVVIDEYYTNNDSLTYKTTYLYENVPEDYYVSDFFFHEESNSFYILEKNEVPMVTVYQINEEG